MSRVKGQNGYNPEKSRYIARRFIPGAFLAVTMTLGWVLVDITKIHWVAAGTGVLLALYLYVIRTAAEKRFTAGNRTTTGSPSKDQ